ncbi:phosphate ABC transporter substrate-binding protein PstS [Mycobacterium camsae]|uniref:phosphate ABC transporter substrate-binding protein PstS n=1 Tax=Mycobacterium gordonae TaxID=1778 RepID=UPI00197F57E6|nr:phosphate ABC transporter substrate-binding protein PstS [Mycobacterium gordonae]
MRLDRPGAISIAAAMVLTLSGCGGADNVSAPNSAAGSSPAKVDCGGKSTLTASGSTAQANAMSRFVSIFERACPGQRIDYTANGSGAGIREFIGRQTDFGGSDSPLNPSEYAGAEQRCGSPAWNLPVVFGPIAVTYHVDGVSTLTLDGPTAAKIFNGTITNWNDPAIAALNSSARLPAEPIRVVYRSDDSGTSDNFQRYLDTASGGAWGKGAARQFKGGVGEGAEGNDGTAAAVGRTEGTISYNEWSFAQTQHLDMARIITSAGGDPVAISSDSVARTIASAGIVNEGNDLVLDTISFYRPSQPGSYPIVLATYEVVCSKYPDAQQGTAVRAFLQSTIGSGQTGLADHGYIPIPDAFRARLSTAVNAIS